VCGGRRAGAGFAAGPLAKQPAQHGRMGSVLLAQGAYGNMSFRGSCGLTWFVRGWVWVWCCLCKRRLSMAACSAVAVLVRAVRGTLLEVVRLPCSYTRQLHQQLLSRRERPGPVPPLLSMHGSGLLMPLGVCRFLVPWAAVLSAAGLGPKTTRSLSLSSSAGPRCSLFSQSLHTGARHALLSMRSCRVAGG
jgi:hypothetical protein